MSFQAESKTKISKRYLVIGGIITTGWLLFGLLAPFVVALISFFYPAVQSIKALEHDKALLLICTFDNLF